MLARFLAFRFFAQEYLGRMKKFLDETFEKFNKDWPSFEPKVRATQDEFEKGVDELISVFGDNVARKPGSVQFNRAIFDALIYYHSQQRVRTAVRSKGARLRKSYNELFVTGSGFMGAIESDTAGAPNTFARLELWGKALSKITGHTFDPPSIPHASKSPKPRAKKTGRR